jgi:hypothetical protein
MTAPSPTDLLFEASTPLGFKVRVTGEYWKLIVSVKHPVMSGRKENVKMALDKPDAIKEEVRIWPR